MKHNVTFVTGLWDMGRGNLESFKRSFDNYLENFERLLSLDINLVIFAPDYLNDFILSRRSLTNTVIVKRNNEDFKQSFDFYDRVQHIRTNSDWYNQVGWLAESPQARLELYNPVVMSKMFMLHTAVIYKNFNTDYYFWIDAGLTNTVGLNFLQNLNNVTGYMQKHAPDRALFITYPYVGSTEIHGFERTKLAELSGTDYVDYVPRGGFFGGYGPAIDQLNGNYWSYLNQSLNHGCMGTEESIFCILCHRYSNLIHRYEIEDNGLVWPFFNQLSDYQESAQSVPVRQRRSFDDLKTSLYILTYNSPEQLQGLLWTFEQTDAAFLKKPKLYLINNSLDRSTDQRYNELCNKYNIEQLKFDNIGVCGGRQFAAEHFHKSDSDYYVFFEDDMYLFPPSNGVVCRSGYRTYIPNLYHNTLSIIYREGYDYLKLTYTEFFGTNQKQWAWYNIDDRVRQLDFPQSPVRTDNTADCPDTVITRRKQQGDIEYFEGEYHYCNWPMWMGHEGNYKIFIENPIPHKYEQIWMANTYYQIKQGTIKPAVMGLSPINHHRFVFYHANERKES